MIKDIQKISLSLRLKQIILLKECIDLEIV